MPEISSAFTKKFLLGDLLESRVVDTDGHVLGHVADIQVSRHPPYEVQGLFYGRRGWWHRLHLPTSFPDEASGRRNAAFASWETIDRLEPGIVFLKQSEKR